MHIRPAELKDIPQIVILGKQLLQIHEEFDYDYYQLEESFDETFSNWIKDQIGKEVQFLFVAEMENGQIAGFISGFLKALYPWFRTKTVGHISYMIVNPRFRRLGVGKKLETEASVWFRSRNIKYVELYVEEKNIVGQRAWYSYGFAFFKKFLQKKV